MAEETTEKSSVTGIIAGKGGGDAGTKLTEETMEKSDGVSGTELEITCEVAGTKLIAYRGGNSAGTKTGATGDKTEGATGDAR